MKFKDSGTVVMVDAEENGIGKAGRPWRKRAVVIDTEAGTGRSFPNPVKVTFWNEKTALVAALQEGDEVSFEFYLRGSEYNGRYRVELNGAELNVLKAAPRDTAIPQPSAHASAAPAATGGVEFADNDDLPF